MPLRGDRVAVGYPRYRSALLGAGALALCLARSNGGFGDFPPPRPIGSCLARPQSCPCVCHRARVAVLRCVRLAVNVCFALPTDFPRMTGATRSAKPPKSERGVFRLSRLAEKQPHSLSRLRRASPPPLGRHPALVRQSAAFKTETRKVPRLSAALLGSIRACNVGRVGTRQKWRGAR